MYSGKFRQEDLIDSVVIDKEGFICGYVEGFNIRPNNIILRLYRYEIRKDESPDEEQLVKRLVDLIPKKEEQSPQNERKSLYDWVRETLSLSNREPVLLEHLVKLADFKSVVIPRKNRELKVKIGKGSIPWSSIKKIALTDLGKCILLNEIVEAKNRGIAVSDKVSYRDTKDISGKIVIDSEAKIVGTAVNFLVGSPPGILMNVERVTREQKPNIEALKKSLIPSRFQTLSQLLNRVKTDLHQSTVNDLNIVVWAMRRGIPVLNEMVETRNVIMELSIGWEKISKIGDVVILSETIEVLSRFY